MPEHSFSDREIRVRTVEALETAKADPGLASAGRPFIQRARRSFEELGLFADGLVSDVQSGVLDCQGIRDRLVAEFPKNSKTVHELRRFLLEQRIRLREWVVGNLDIPHAPQVRFSRLGALSDDNLESYFFYYHELSRQRSEGMDYFQDFVKKVSRDCGFQAMEALASSDQERLRQILPANLFVEFLSLRQKAALKTRDESFRYGVLFPLENLSSLFERYIQSGQIHALKVLQFILSQNGAQSISIFESLLRQCFVALKENDHFIRSVFTLLNENFYSPAPGKKLDPLLIRIIFRIFMETGICSEFHSKDTLHDVNEPRSEFDFILVLSSVSEKGEIENWNMCLRIPSRYIPVSWNNHRLVFPSRNKDFQKLGDSLDRQRFGMNFLENEIRRFQNDLVSHRRYHTNFSRMKVTDIPGVPEDEIWFYFSQDTSMDSADMRVEVIMNGASIVCFLTGQGEIEFRDRGIFFPDHPNFRPQLYAEMGISRDEDIESVYHDLHFFDWISGQGMTVLKYFILKYAHALLVTPRNLGVKKGGGSGGGIHLPPDGGIFLSLDEYETETFLHHDGGDAGFPQSGRKVPVFHGVDGHIRPLPEGKTHSSAAGARALERGIVLAPDQTYIQPYSRGLKITEQQVSGKKLRE